MIRSNSTGENLRLEVVFSQHRSARHAPHYSDLADVGDRVGDGSLEESLGWEAHGFVGGQIVIELSRKSPLLIAPSSVERCDRGQERGLLPIRDFDKKMTVDFRSHKKSPKR